MLKFLLRLLRLLFLSALILVSVFVMVALSGTTQPILVLAVPVLLIALFLIYRLARIGLTGLRGRQSAKNVRETYIAGVNRERQRHGKAPMNQAEIASRFPRRKKSGFNWIWPMDGTRGQKIVAAVVYLNVFGLLAAIFHKHGYAPSNLTIQVSLVFAIILTLLSLWGLFKMKLEDQSIISRLRRGSFIGFCFTLLALVGFLFVIYFVNLAVPLPRTYTAMFGESSIIGDTVVKRSQRKFCRTGLKPGSFDNLSFAHCVAGDLFERVPKQGIPARLTVKRSVMGTYIESIELEF